MLYTVVQILNEGNINIAILIKLASATLTITSRNIWLMNHQKFINFVNIFPSQKFMP